MSYLHGMCSNVAGCCGGGGGGGGGVGGAQCRERREARACTGGIHGGVLDWLTVGESCPSAVISVFVGRVCWKPEP